jgi:hypothetical protein
MHKIEKGKTANGREFCKKVTTGLLLLPSMDQGNRVAVNHADTVGLVQKRAKSCETADLLSSYKKNISVYLRSFAVDRAGE